MLRDEDSWLCPAVIPHSLVQLCKGGMSCILKELLRLFFMGPQGFVNGVAATGRTIMPVLMVARLSNLIADEAALKASLCAKGASGVKPCLQCKNIVMKGPLIQHDASNYVRNICCSSVKDFDIASDTDIWALADFLAGTVASKSEMREIEKSCGLNAIEEGILRFLLALVYASENRIRQ